MTPTVAAIADAVSISRQSTRPLPSARKGVDATAIAARKLKERPGNIGWTKREL